MHTVAQRMLTVLRVIVLLISVTNVFLHILGTHLLICIYKNANNRRTTEHIYLINLAICEALINIVEVIRFTIQVIPSSGIMQKILHEVRYCMLIAMFTGNYIVLFLDLICMTVDRFFKVKLGIRYRLYWNIEKTKLLITFQEIR